ncbi:Non-specific phospholipase C2 [Linum perenne]
MLRRRPSSGAAATSLFTFLLLLLSNNVHHIQSAAINNPIKTVVVVVMENRSFDHMLGWMKKLNPEINGVDGTQWNPLNTSDPNSGKFYFQDQAHYVDPDPGHSFQAIREQIFGSNDTSEDPPPMNGFAQQAFSMDPSANMSRDVMNGFHPDSVAVYKALVSEFAVFDRWFASVPSSTQPNRLYVHSGTSSGATSNIPALLVKGYPQRTIFENVDDAGLSWGIYYQNIPATLFYRNLRKLKYVTNFRPYDLLFKSHAKQGKLPNYVVVEQRYTDLKIAPANDDHPSHDVYNGQMFVKEVYETLRASPQWNETMLIITYDEHGGFYDHVPTPVDGVPSPDGIVGPEPFNFTFNRLGVRVPTIVVSPWINKATVVHGPNGQPTPTSEYEHSSIPATGIRQGDANEDAKLSEFQQEMLQLAAVLKGDHILSSYPNEIGKKMSVKEGTVYMEDAVKRFFQAGRFAKKMGVDDEQIVQMKPSLTTRPSSTKITNNNNKYP